MADLPVRFKERMKELLGEGYEAFEASYDKERVQGLVNILIMRLVCTIYRSPAPWR